VGVASTSAGASKRRNGAKLRHASTTFPLNGLATNVGHRLTRVVQERPIMALSGAVALGFVTGAAFARRDGHLFIGAARIVLSWVAANLDA
jgi:hypothetical protein